VENAKFRGENFHRLAEDGHVPVEDEQIMMKNSHSPSGFGGRLEAEGKFSRPSEQAGLARRQREV
jgi:hypothetical protein